MTAPCLGCARHEGRVHRLQAELANAARKATTTHPPTARALTTLARARRERDAARTAHTAHTATCPAVP